MHKKETSFFSKETTKVVAKNYSVADPERFDADPDPHPTFQANADADPVRIQNIFS